MPTPLPPDSPLLVTVPLPSPYLRRPTPCAQAAFPRSTSLRLQACKREALLLPLPPVSLLLPGPPALATPGRTAPARLVSSPLLPSSTFSALPAPIRHSRSE